MLKKYALPTLGLSICLTAFSCQPAEQKTAAATAEAPQHNTLTPAEIAEGWELLFNGTDLAGWHKYGGEPAGSAWKVEEGSLTLDPSTKDGWQIQGGGDIVTDKVFGDFHLSLEWKIAQNGNSGIVFYIQEDTVLYNHTWKTGPEMQVLDNAGHPDAQIEKHRAGDLYDLIACSEESVKPFGEWNLAEIKSEGGQLNFWLNGVNVVSTTLWDEAWQNLIAGSKFADMPGFGTFREGRIGLQDHGDQVWYRNVKIRGL